MHVDISNPIIQIKIVGSRKPIIRSRLWLWCLYKSVVLISFDMGRRTKNKLLFQYILKRVPAKVAISVIFIELNRAPSNFGSSGSIDSRPIFENLPRPHFYFAASCDVAIDRSTNAWVVPVFCVCAPLWTIASQTGHWILTLTPTQMQAGSESAGRTWSFIHAGNYRASVSANGSVDKPNTRTQDWVQGSNGARSWTRSPEDADPSFYEPLYVLGCAPMIKKTTSTVVRTVEPWNTDSAGRRRV